MDSLSPNVPLPPAADVSEPRIVLCVDDEPHVLSALRRALRMPGPAQPSGKPRPSCLSWWARMIADTPCISSSAMR